jgi:two-component system, cell cycle sensor histidine kinase and response regulator CckA
MGKVVTDDEGRSERMFGIVVDVTASKEAEIARAWAEHRSGETRRMESLGRLAGGVAHDFNNLLTVVIGGTDLALRDLHDPTARSLLEQVREAGLRGSELIRQLLDFGRPDADGVEVVDVRERVEGLRALLCRVLGEVVRLEMRQAGQPLPVEIAPGRLDQVVINLCVNARDAMPGGGRLEVVTEERVVDDAGARIAPGRWVVLSVRDEGEGMTPEQAARVFEPFYTTKPAGEGTGLGLASVYGIVTGRGGQVQVETAPGEGTTFEIWLPRSSGLPREHAPPPSTTADRAPSDAPSTVLIVEDEPAVRDLIRACLEGDGLRVVEATDGVDALRVLAAHSGRVDLLITDVVMPHLDGPCLVRRVRAEHPALPVLYLTGYAGDAGRQGLLVDDRVLSKPFAYRDLISAARELLGGGAETHPRDQARLRR